MKTIRFLPIVLGVFLLASCAAPSLGESGGLARGVEVGSSTFCVGNEEVLCPLPWEEEQGIGGGIGPWDGQRGPTVPFEQEQVFGLSYYQGSWYACEKDESECMGDGAQLLRWDEEEKQQKKVADLCACENSCYLLFEDWVFYTKRCSQNGTAKGICGYHPAERRFCFFEGEAVGLGMRDGQPHFLVLKEEGAALCRLVKTEDSFRSEQVALWEELPLSAERLRKGKCLLGEETAIFLQGEGFCLLEEGKKPRFFSAEAHCAALSEEALFYGSHSALYRLGFGEDTPRQLVAFSAKDARFSLFVLDDSRVVFEVKKHRMVDFLLWRWEWEELMLWEESKGCATLASRGQCTPLGASQIPWVIAFPA